jgi:hypothetical protein
VSKTCQQVPDGNDARLTAVPLPEAAAKALDPRTLPDANSEFCRMGDLRRLFGIVRSTAYLLAKEGHIKTISLRRKGQIRSIRLVSVPSVRAYLGRLLAEQNLTTPTTEDAHDA